MLQNEYLLAKFGVDTAENEPLRARNRARIFIAFSAFSGKPRRIFKALSSSVTLTGTSQYQ